MNDLSKLLYALCAVAIALAGNSVSAVWARGENKMSLWLLLLLVLSPLVFISFGLATAKLGVAIGAGVMDSLLAVATILLGLIFFKEWNKISVVQYVGIAFSVVGICLMLFFPKTKV